MTDLVPTDEHGILGLPQIPQINTDFVVSYATTGKNNLCKSVRSVGEKLICRIYVWDKSPTDYTD